MMDQILTANQSKFVILWFKLRETGLSESKQYFVDSKNEYAKFLDLCDKLEDISENDDSIDGSESQSSMK